MIETRKQRSARDRVEYADRERRAVAYAAKMGSPAGLLEYGIKNAIVKLDDDQATAVLAKVESGELKAVPVSKFDRNAYQRAYMRRKRAKEKGG